MRIFKENDIIIIDFLFTLNRSVYDLEEHPKFHICNKGMKYFDILTKQFVDEKKQYSMIPKRNGVYISDITGLLSYGEYYIFVEVNYNNNIFTETEFYRIEQTNSDIIYIDYTLSWSIDGLNVNVWLRNRLNQAIMNIDSGVLKILSMTGEVLGTYSIDDIYYLIDDIDFVDTHYLLDIEINYNSSIVRTRESFVVVHNE